MGNALDEAIEKAGEGLCRPSMEWNDVEWTGPCDQCTQMARAAVLAALPSLAEHFAAHIISDGPKHPYKADEQTRINAWCNGLHFAASVVRALGQESTE